MYYAPQILLFCLAWMRAFEYSVAKEPLDPELLRKFTKDVETVLSPTLIEGLQGVRSNRSAINVAQTVPRNPEPPRGVDERKPEIQFDNNVYPYHYERSYHYQYPPNPQDGSSGPVIYSENFFEPRFRPRSQPVDSRDPSYYRSELYNPFDSSSTAKVDSYPNSDPRGNFNPKDNPGTGIRGIQISNGHSSSGVHDGSTPAPPISFAPPHPNRFPNTDYDGYRPGFSAESVGSNGHFGPGGSAAQRQNDPHSSRYLPQGEGSFSKSFHRRPVESYRNLPPLEFHGYDEHRSILPESSPEKSQYLPPPFLGSFLPPGYQNHFQNDYRPSHAFKGLFSENFTREFPSRQSFGGFYPSHSYLSPPTSSAPSTPPTLPAHEPENSVPPGGPSNQPIPTTKPDDQATVPVASNSNYQAKLFFPAGDNVNYNLQSDGPEKFAVRNFK